MASTKRRLSFTDIGQMSTLMTNSRNGVSTKTYSKEMSHKITNDLRVVLNQSERDQKLPI